MPHVRVPLRFEFVNTIWFVPNLPVSPNEEVTCWKCKMLLVLGRVMGWMERVLLLLQHALRGEKQGGQARKQDASMIVARTTVAGRR